VVGQKRAYVLVPNEDYWNTSSLPDAGAGVKEDLEHKKHCLLRTQLRTEVKVRELFYV